MDQDFKTPQAQPPVTDNEPTNASPEPVQVTPPSSEPKKSGKKVLVVLAIVLLALAVAAVGWWYGTSKAQKEADAQVAELQSKIAKLEDEQKATQADNTDDTTSTKYLTITQWGVKLPLTPDIYDAIYALGGQSALVRLSTEAIAKLDPTCDPRQDGDAQAGMGRAKPNATVLEDQPVKVAYPNGRVIGDYYYYFVSPQSACGKNPTLEVKVTSAFKAAIGSVEAVN